MFKILVSLLLIPLFTIPIYAEEVGVKEGDWVKYKLDLDVDSENQFLQMMGNMITKSIIPNQDYALGDIEWIKIEITEIDKESDKLYGQFSFFVFDKEEFLNEMELSFDSDSMFNHAISIDTKVGDRFPANDYGTPVVVDTEKRKYGSKTTEVFKVRTTSSSTSDGTITETSVYSYYDKKTGMMLESEMNFNFANALLGAASVDLSLKAIDYHLPRASNLGGGCLIATATYGTELAPQVQQLRELRDNVLLQTNSGTDFINSFNEIYYSFSPQIADFERENPVFKETVKIAITPLISSLLILNHVDIDLESDVLFYGIGLIILNFSMYVGIPVGLVISARKISF